MPRPAMPERLELSEMEKQICGLVADGLYRKDIAEVLGKSVKAIDYHLSRIMLKHRITGSTAVGIAKLAYQLGIRVAEKETV